VLDEARHYYHALWGSCSRNEKLVLYHLAQDGLVCSRNVDLLSLLARGLIVQNPHLELMNQSFSKFVIAVSRPSEVRSWSRTKQTSRWNRWRVPAFAGLLGIAMFFFFTQREAYEHGIAFLTAGIPGLLKLLGIMTGRGFGKD
jgi:hypothetical protein